MIGALYRPGTTPLHRLPAGIKILGLGVLCAGLAFVATWVWLGVALVIVLVIAVVAGLGPRALWRIVAPLRFIVPVLVVVQLLITTPEAAVTLTGRLVLAVAFAGIVTATTRTTAMLEAMERGLGPLRRVGVDPTRIALLVALAIRSIPVLAALVTRIREAQRARGVERSLRAFAVPLVVGVLREADQLGEALAARGLDD